MGSKLTIQDIARLAGVSKATVSRVLNQKSNVDPVTRERVLRIMKEKSFVPSITAAGLAGGRTRLIGVLAPPLTWPTVPEIMRGVAEVIEHTSYEIVLYSISPARNHRDVLDRILAMKLSSGLLAILPGQLSEHLNGLHDQGLPIVTIDDQGPPTSIPWVGIDNRSSAYEATRHLIELGHRRIAHVKGPEEFRCSLERYEGYQQALLEAGIEPDPRYVFQGSFEIIGGRQQARAIFSMHEHEWPTAIFVGNDQMAYGVLTVAEEYGVRIPEDMAVVGFDDIPLSAHMKPTLTTVKQPLYEIGEKAIELLLSFIEPQNPFNNDRQEGSLQPSSSLPDREPIRIQLATSLIVRESCGTPRKLTISS